MATSKQKSSCPGIKKVQLYIDGLLSKAEAESFTRHLSECPGCQKEHDSILNVRASIHCLADEAPPGLDKDALFARIPAGSLPHRRLLPTWKLALAGACAVILIFSWIALKIIPKASIHPSLASRPGVSMQATRGLSVSPISGPVLVTYLSGEAKGPMKQESEWIMPLDKDLQVKKDSGVALRLDDKTSAVVLGGSSLRIGRKQGWELELTSGIVAVRLDKPRKTGLSVVCSVGRIDALGTVFSVEQLGEKSCCVHLAQGRLSLTNASGQHFTMTAPARRVLKDTALEVECGSGSENSAIELTRILGHVSEEPLGLVRISSSPSGAFVQTEGIEIGRTPLIFSRHEKPLVLTFSADGFLTETLRVVPKPGVKIHKHVILRPVDTGSRVQNPDPVARARQLLAKRKVSLAKSILRKNLSKHPDDPRTLMLLADAHRLSSDAEKSLDMYLRVAALSDDDNLCEAAMYHAGLLRLNALNRPHEALVTFRSISRQFPNGLLRQEVAFHVAESYLRLKDFDRALRSLRDYLRLYPGGTRAEDAKGLLKKLEDAGWK